MFPPRSALFGAFPLVIRVRLRLGVHQGEGQLRGQLAGQRAQVQLHLHLGRAQGYRSWTKQLRDYNPKKMSAFLKY